MTKHESLESLKFKPEQKSEEVEPVSEHNIPKEDEDNDELYEGLIALEQSLKEVESLRKNLEEAIDSKDEAAQKELAAKLRVALVKGLAINKEVSKELGLEVELGPIPTILTEFKYKDERGEEKTEKIKIDFNKKLNYSLEFYERYFVDLPPDFSETMRDIWAKNIDEIEKVVTEKGFDEILLVPAGISPGEFFEKANKIDTSGRLSVGHNFWYCTDDNFASVVAENMKPKIVLIHKSRCQNLLDRPDLALTMNKTCQSFIDQGENLTLTDYLIFEEQYAETTGKQLESSCWLPGSAINETEKRRNPNLGGIYIEWKRGGNYPLRGRDDIDTANSNIPLEKVGCRLSRSFF